MPATRNPMTMALVLAAATSLAACGSGGSTAPVVKPDTTKPATPADTTPLRVYGAARGRWIGAATGSVLTMPGDSGNTLRAIVAREFSMLWTGTFMKMDYLRPNRGTFNYASADAVVAFAQQHNMVVRGHTLVWHQQVPAWVSTSGYGPDTLGAILKDHIENVVGHFKGKLTAWDVVNEAMGDDGNIRQTSIWYQNLGPDYIEHAFHWAHDADPNVPLYYNDYNIETQNPKSDAVYRMLTELKAKGAPIDGIGFQFHYIASRAPTYDAIASNFARFAALGLKIQITEADMHVPVVNGIASSADQQVQADAYRNMAAACLSTPACNAIEIEGIYDGQAWVGDPGYGAPVLYDIHMKPKPAYYAVQAALKQ